jgi:uncharacterized protein
MTRHSNLETERDDSSTLRFEERPEGAILAVRALPRASRSAIEGVRQGALLVRLAAPPLAGAANTALLEIIADRLGVPRRRVRLVSGERSRSKRVQVLGVSGGEILARLDDR